MSSSRRYLWHLCGSRALLCLIFTAYSGILPYVLAEWSMSAKLGSSIQSGWHIAYLISLFTAGFLSDRFGAQNVYLVAAALSALATTLFALFAHDHASAFALYFLVALFSGGTYTSGLALVFLKSDAASRGRGMGLFLAASSIGYAAGLFLIALAVQLWSWRAGLLAIMCGSWLGALQAWTGMGGLAPAPAASSARGNWLRSMLAALGDRAALMVNLAYTFHCWELFALWAWMPAFLIHVLKTGSANAGLGIMLAAGAHLVSVLGSLAGGAASDRFGRLRTICLIGMGSATCSLLAAWSSTWPMVLICVFFAFYNLLAIADSAIYSTALAEAVSPERLGAAFSVRSVMGFTAGALAPLVFGATLDSAWLSARFGADANWVVAWSTVGLIAALVPVVATLQRRAANESRAA